jgi:hypothetical protein
MDAFDIPIIGPLLLAAALFRWSSFTGPDGADSAARRSEAHEARCAALLKTYSRQRVAGASPRWPAGC